MYQEIQYTHDSYDDYAAAPLGYPRGSADIHTIFPLMIVFFGLLSIIIFIRWVTMNYQIPQIAVSEQPLDTGLIQMESPADQSIPATRDSSAIAPFFTPEIQRWSEKIETWGDRYGVEPNLIATVMQIESCGNPSVFSPAGARGLFQVMPYHFADGEDHLKPGTNAMRGIGYLTASLKAHNGDVRLALAGYNGGINGSKRPENQWPYETQRYVHWGYQIYLDAMKGKNNSARLNEWLSRGGSSLCQRAALELGLSQ